MSEPPAQRKRDAYIDENLKRVYESAVEEGVPDRFRILLEELRRQERDKGSCS
jgi:hypothetical protein